MEDGPENRSVFKVIVLQRQRVNEDREDLVERNRGGVSQYQTTDGASSIVSSIQFCGRRVWRHIEQRSEGRKKKEILRGEIYLGMFNEEARCICRITPDFVVFIAQCAVQQLE
jgi:hypothetical protein